MDKLINQHVITLFRAQTSSGIYFTLGRLQKLNNYDQDYYINIIIAILDIKSNDYNNELITKIVISFGKRDGVAPLNPKNINITFTPTSTYQNYKHYKLPVTMNPLEYGSNPVLANNSLYVVPITPLTIAKITIKNKGMENKIDIYKNGKLVISYTDKKIDQNNFERIIGLNKYIYSRVDENHDYKLDLFTVNKPNKSINPKKEDKKINNKIITMDIETYNDNGKMIPYLLCLNTENESKAYFISNYKNVENLIMTAISDLMKVKYNGYKIYIHNFAKFDAIFLLKYLNKLGHVNLVINNGKIISIDLSWSKKETSRSYSLYFNDSYQLLLASLKKLSKCFDVSTKKGIFPHRFVTKNNLDYVGSVPSFEFFDNITYSEYIEYSSKFNNN